MRFDVYAAISIRGSRETFLTALTGIRGQCSPPTLRMVGEPRRSTRWL